MADLLHDYQGAPDGLAEEGDRRHEPRVGSPTRPAVRYALAPSAPLRWGYAADVSRAGVCFLADAPVPVGSALEVHALEGPPACVRVVRVAHCDPTGLGGWRVGCEVYPPFTLEEMASLL